MVHRHRAAVGVAARRRPPRRRSGTGRSGRRCCAGPGPAWTCRPSPARRRDHDRHRALTGSSTKYATLLPSAAAIFIRPRSSASCRSSRSCAPAGESPARCASCASDQPRSARAAATLAPSAETVRSMSGGCVELRVRRHVSYGIRFVPIRICASDTRRRGRRGEVGDHPASGEGHRALRHVREGLPGRQGRAWRDRLHVHAHRALRGLGRPGQPADHHARAAQGLQDPPGPVRARRADGLRHARLPEGRRRGLPGPHGDQQPAARRSSTRAAPSTRAGSRRARSTGSRRTC